MTKTKLLSLSLAILFSVTSCFADNATKSAPSNSTTVKESNTTQQLVTDKERAAFFETLGWSLVNDSGIGLVEPTPEELENLFKGMEKAVKGQPLPMEASAESVSEMDQYFQERLKSNQTKVVMENKVKENSFFEELDQNKNVQKLASGLYYQIINPGSENKPKSTDTVKVHYKGTLVDGTEFDSSYKRGEPAEFPLSGVIPAFREGMTLIGEGGKAVLYAPSELGYGDVSTGRIPAGSTLIFEVELIKVNP